MTVRELIEQLQRCDQEAQVYSCFYVGDYAAVGRVKVVESADRVVLLHKPERHR